MTCADTGSADGAATPRSHWEQAAWAAWAVLALAVALRIAFASDPAKNNVYLKVFAPAADAFAAGDDLYRGAGGFRYPPICAALLWPFARCGAVAGSILWRAVNVAVLLVGARAVFRTALPFAFGSRE